MQTDATTAPSDPYGTSRKKNELAIAASPGDFEVYRLTMPIQKNGLYKDFPDYDAGAAIKAVMDMIGEIDEIKLIGNDEWMQEWDSTEGRIDLGENEGEFTEETIENYFQNTTETTQYGGRDHWRFAIEYNKKEDVPVFIKTVKAKLRAAEYSARFESNTFQEMIEYDAGWLSGADPDTLQTSALKDSIDQAFGRMSNKPIFNLGNGEEGADKHPVFVLRTKRYSSSKANHTRTTAPVIAVICEQKNLSRIRRLLEELHGENLKYGFNEFVSTKCNADQRWECLNQHITAVLSKQYFYVTGAGLDDVTNILDEPVTFAGKTGSFRSLLNSKGLYAFIQNAKYGGGSKLVCQHEANFETKSGSKTTTISPRAWFVNEIIMADNNDWTIRQFNPRHKLYPGRPMGKNAQQSPSISESKKSHVPINIWQQRADEKSRTQSKASEGNESLESLRSQLTEEQSNNKRLSEENSKLSATNNELTAKFDKLSADNVVNAAKYTAQAERINKQERQLREMKSTQEMQMREMQQRQADSDAQVKMLLARLDTDEQMKNETKRYQPDSSDALSTPEAKQQARSKKQAERSDPPSPLTLMLGRTNSPPASPSRTIAAITAAADVQTRGLRHRANPSTLQQASTSCAKTSGGSKK